MTLSTTRRLSVPRETWTGWFSSAIEAYNMAVYSFASPFLAVSLFQNSAPKSAILFSYCLLFVASCLFYPLGAAYYGFLGDRKGRQTTCTYSALGLAVATGLMGVVPLNWFYFLLLICAQHFFSGGEYHGSVVFSLEHAHERKGGMISAVSCLFAVCGLVLAKGSTACAASSLNEGWMRLSFAVGGVGGLLSYILKHYCQETPIFAAHRHLARSHSLDKRAVAGAVLVLSFFIVSYSFIFILLPLVYQEEASGGATLQTLILYGALLLLAGWAADRWGMRTVMALGAALMALSAPLLARYCASLCLIQSVLTACASLVIGPIHGWMLHHFRPQERCRGIFISSAIATALFGGSTVPICLMLYEASHSPLLCSAYPAAVAACCFFYLFRRGA